MFENRFKDQVAIVTGAASGIGEAIARRLAAEGGAVALFDVNTERLTRVESDLKAQNAPVMAITVDITDENAVRDAVQQVVDAYGRLDVMVHSAGIVGLTSTPIVDYDSETFRRVLDVNLYGSYLMTRYAVEAMLPNDYGRVLLLASIGGKDGNPGMVGYATSKSGVMGLVKGVGKEYAHTGITVNGLAPAVIRTPMNEDTSPEMLKYMADKIPMKRLGTVEEAAAIACWIVSKEATFNTGFVFDLSGGRATY